MLSFHVVHKKTHALDRKMFTLVQWHWEEMFTHVQWHSVSMRCKRKMHAVDWKNASKCKLTFHLV